MSGCVGRALLLLCGLGLGFGLGVALPSRIGYCTGDLCSFQESLDFEGARRVCAGMLGQLFVLDSGEDLKLLSGVLKNLGGAVWLRSRNRTTEVRDGLCPSASPGTDRDPKLVWQTCGDKLSGFVCQYGPGEVCRGVAAAGGAPVKYSTSSGFGLDGSDTFPPGTFGVAQRPGDEYPDSKYLCFSEMWLPAPWTCEVLNGGCAHSCSMDACRCPDGEDLHPNGFSCVTEPDCGPGFRLTAGGSGCVEVNGCEEGNECEAGGAGCVPERGGFHCMCADGFEWEDGACVNVSICSLCEHMDCQKYDGVYQCACRDGYMVSPKDPTKCTWNCTERDCPAICDPNQGPQCFCPDGYVIDQFNQTVLCTDINECEAQTCDHRCDNLFGGYRCTCMEGFELQDEYKCVPLKNDDEEAEGSGFEYPTQGTVTAAGLQPPALPQYIKTGSILGITVFLLLCVVLLALFTRNAVKRCGRFELSTFKHPDLDIYYLQQVSTETYKRLSFDRQQKNDPQRL